ncbi:uncharacterized protein LOC135294993 isoform X3 [Passer domesticus]|uniref:uncharacterized protein LOC135294993 isoform X3 n=1 Tax=Passer domesticus TaxID=48849 RepID=UPI0030FE3315
MSLTRNHITACWQSFIHLPQNTWKKERTWIGAASSNTKRITNHKLRLTDKKRANKDNKSGFGKEMESLDLSQNSEPRAKVMSSLKTSGNIGSQAVRQCLLSVQSQNKEYFPNCCGPLQYGECNRCGSANSTGSTEVYLEWNKAVRVDSGLEKMWAVVMISWIIVYVKVAGAPHVKCHQLSPGHHLLHEELPYLGKIILFKEHCVSIFHTVPLDIEPGDNNVHVLQRSSATPSSASPLGCTLSHSGKMRR